MNLNEYSSQNDTIFIAKALSLDAVIYSHMNIFYDIFREFGLEKQQYKYKSVNVEYEDYNLVLEVPEEHHSEFKNVAYGLFFYEIATDVVKDDNYLEKIKNILLDNFPLFKDENYIPDENNERENLFWDVYRYFSRTESLYLQWMYKNQQSVEEKLEELLEVPNLNDEIIYKKYEKKQIENYIKYCNCEGDIDSLVDNMAGFVNFRLWERDVNFGTHFFRFGYLKYAFGGYELKAVLKKTILMEIKAFLREKIRDFSKEEGFNLGKNQIIRLASIEDFDAFHQRVVRSCNEYFYVREIARAERLLIYENIFGKNVDTTEKLEVEEKELAEEQPKKESNEEIEKLQKQLEQLKKENEDLKKKLNNKEKEYLSDLRNIREENDKKFNLQQEKIKEMLRQNIGWALMFQVITLEEHEDDLLYPYKLEALQNKRVLVLGGRDEVRREFAKVIPQAIFIESETQKIPTGKIDCIFIFNRYFSHSLFYKYIRYARKNDIPVGYTPSTNMERILSDLYVAVKRIYELEIPEFILD